MSERFGRSTWALCHEERGDGLFDKLYGTVVHSCGEEAGRNSRTRVTLSSMPSKYSEAVLLVGEEGMSPVDAALVCGISAEAFRRLSRARAMLGEGRELTEEIPCHMTIRTRCGLSAFESAVTTSYHVGRCRRAGRFLDLEAGAVVCAYLAAVLAVILQATAGTWTETIPAGPYGIPLLAMRFPLKRRADRGRRGSHSSGSANFALA